MKTCAAVTTRRMERKTILQILPEKGWSLAVLTLGTSKIASCAYGRNGRKVTIYTGLLNVQLYIGMGLDMHRYSLLDNIFSILQTNLL